MPPQHSTRTQLVIRNARVVASPGSGSLRGDALRQLHVRPRADVVVDGGVIVTVEDGTLTPQLQPAREIDARGRVLMPAFVDCHTHAMWAGHRLDEWEAKQRGATYLDILAAGGGIMSTVRAVRAEPEASLAATLRDRALGWFARNGTLTLEVKSGYGLSTNGELKMLRAIRSTSRECADRVTILPTALLGHAIDPDVANTEFVRRTIEETLPAVHAEFPSVAVDAYCETGAWTVEQTVALLERARASGHPVRVHADQFNSLGMVAQAIRLGARSVDHLEASTDADLDALAASGTFGVVLPQCGVHLDGRYAKARRFVDAGGALALATNCNPGSAPSASMPLAIALAVRHCGLSCSEAINACTVNAAALLGCSDRGFIAPGARADLILLHHADERGLAYELGGNPVDCVIAQGKVIHGE